MILALSTLDPTVTAVCYLAAFILFVVAAVLLRPTGSAFIAAGLALFVVPFAWNALAAS